MNIIHIKYAVEVARFGSINKASENLGMAQPNISRAIKDLEADLGISIFDRSAKGMNLTPEGKEFISYAQSILNQLNELENLYKNDHINKQKISISAPKGGYISDAFIEFSGCIENHPAEIVFNETGAHNTIKKVSSSDCKLGIIRYDIAADKFFKKTLTENGLDFEIIATYKYVLLMSKNSPLKDNTEIFKSDLKNMLQISHTSPYAATLSASDNRKEDFNESSDRCIFITDTTTQLELLSKHPDAFMWVSPSSQTVLDRYGLIQRECADNNTEYADVLIYSKGYKFSDLDRVFINELKNSKNNCFK